MKTQITNLDAWHLTVLSFFEIYKSEEAPSQRSDLLGLGIGKPFQVAANELQAAELLDIHYDLTDKGRTLLQHLKGSFRMSSAMHAGFPPNLTSPTARDQELQSQRFVSASRRSPGWRPDLEHLLGFVITARHEGTAAYQHIDLVPKGIANIRERMIAKDMVVVGSDGQPRLTARGTHYLKMLLATPLPVEITTFTDPRMLDEPADG